MHSAFRSRFESRGQALNLMGDSVRDMSREELYAVIGFLLDMSDVDEIETQLGRYAQNEPKQQREPTVRIHNLPRRQRRGRVVRAHTGERTRTGASARRRFPR